jgi:hypothetical protein
VAIGAATTAYDKAHTVLASIGERDAVVRVDSKVGRMTSGRQALLNVEQETTMREVLAAAAVLRAYCTSKDTDR